MSSTEIRPARAIPRVAANPWTPGNPSVPGEDPDQNNVVRKFSLALAFVVVFLRISAFHQMEAYLLHVNLRLLYIFGIPAVLGTLLCGGVQRAMRWSPAYWWTGYVLWMTLAIPFSSWAGGSAAVVSNYIRTNLIMLFIVGGLVVGWKECQTFLRCCALGAAGTLMVARIFQQPKYQERFGLELGTVANPNDFACHLLFCLPFLYYVMLSTKSFALKILCLAGMGYGVILTIQTASRGGLIALIVVALALMVWGTAQQRLALVLLMPLAFAGALAFVSKDALNRIVSFSAGEANASQEALESSQERQYLLNKSIEYAISHPVFGVGADQFPNYEGTRNKHLGNHGSFHGTHNTFTQVASETGVPGLIFFVCGLVACFRIFYSAFRKARNRPECADIRVAALSLMLTMIGFVVSFTFLNFAYFFYQPLLGGIAVAFKSATDMEFQKRDQAPQPIPPVIVPGPFLRHRTSPGIA